MQSEQHLAKILIFCNDNPAIFICPLQYFGIRTSRHGFINTYHIVPCFTKCNGNRLFATLVDKKFH